MSYLAKKKKKKCIYEFFFFFFAQSNLKKSISLKLPNVKLILMYCTKIIVTKFYPFVNHAA